MVAIVPRQSPLPTPQRISREVARSTDRMQLLCDISMAAMDALGQLHSYTAWSAASTLAVVGTLRPPSGLTPAQQAAYQHLTEQYLEMLNRIVQASGNKIVMHVNDVSIEMNGHTSLSDILRRLLS